MLLLAMRGRDAPGQGQCGPVAPSTGASCPPLFLRAQPQFSIHTCVPTPPLISPLASLWPHRGNGSQVCGPHISFVSRNSSGTMTSVLHSRLASWHRQVPPLRQLCCLAYKYQFPRILPRVLASLPRCFVFLFVFPFI